MELKVVFNSQVGWLQSVIARSPLGVRCAVQVSNQCRAILGRAHGSTVVDMAANGEAAIIDLTNKSLRFVVAVGANRVGRSHMVLKNPAVEACLLLKPSASALSALQQRFN